MFQADYIFATDTFWIEQLNQIGINNTQFLIFGYDSETFYKMLKNEIPEKKVNISD